MPKDAKPVHRRTNPGTLQAAILAGGFSMRMRPYTDDRPKAMAEVADEPLISHQLKWLSRFNVVDVVVLVGYKGETIKNYLKDGATFGLRVRYAYETEPVGTGGALRLAAMQLPNQNSGFFALNGDILTQFDLTDLLRQHSVANKLATVALTQYRIPLGVADVDGSTIHSFVQSPVLPYWVNAGVYYLEPRVVNLLPLKGDHEETTFPDLARRGQLGGYRIKGYWRAIETVKDVVTATDELRKSKL